MFNAHSRASRRAFVRRRCSRRSAALAATHVLSESLEARRLLATFNGTAGNDNISVELSNGTLFVIINGGGQSIPYDGQVHTINALGGNDTILVKSHAANGGIIVNGGDGNDTATFGTGDFLANFRNGTQVASLTFNGGNNDDLVVVNDAANAQPRRVLINDQNFSLNVPGVNSSAAGIGMDVAVEGGRVECGSGDDSVEQGSGRVTRTDTVNGNNGADTFRLNAGTDTVGTTQGPLVSNGGAGNDTVAIQENGQTANDSYTVTDAGFTRLGRSYVNPLNGFEAFNFRGFSPYAVTLNLLSMPAGLESPSINLEDAGDWTVVFGSGDFDNEFQDPTVNMEQNQRVIVDGSQDNGAHTWQLYGNTLRDRTTNRTLTYDAPTNMFDSQLGKLELRMGNGADRFNVVAMASDLDVTVNGGAGNDTLDAAAGDLDNNGNNLIAFTVQGDLFFDGGGGTDLLDLDNSNGASTPSNVSVSSTTFDLNQSIFGSITYAAPNLEGLSFVGGTVADTIELVGLANNQRATINGGLGNDTIRNGAAHDIQAQFGNAIVSLLGGGGDDSLVIDDSSETVATITTIAAASLNNDLGTFLGYGEFEALTYTLSTRAEAINVQSANTPTTINAGAGNDTLNLGTNLELITAPIVANLGNNGVDALILTDTADAAGNDPYTVGQTAIAKPGSAFAGVSFAGSNFTTLNANNFNNLITFLANASGVGNLTTFAINGGGGNDTLNVDEKFGHGAINFDGGAGTGDALIIDDSIYIDVNSDYALTATGYQQIGSSSYGNIARSNVEGGTLKTGSAGRTITVDALNEPWTIDAGGGNDTINAGAGDLDRFVPTGTAFIGGGGTGDVLNIADRALEDPGNDVYLITAATIEKGAFSYGYNTFETVNVEGSNRGSTYTIAGASAAFTLNAGGGADTFNVVGTSAANTPGDLDAIGALLTISGGAAGSVGGGGFDAMTVSDVNDANFFDVYNWSGGSISKTSDEGGFGGISYAGVERVTLDANGQDDTINITAPAGTAVVRGNGGADQINVIESSAVITIGGGAGADTLRINADGTGSASAAYVAFDDLATYVIGAGGRLTNQGGRNAGLTTTSVPTTTGVLDLADGYLVIGGGASAASVRALVLAGRNGGTWNGNSGLVSNTAAATTNATIEDALGYATASELQTTTYRGLPIAANSVVVSYTLIGDATLNGTTDFDDLLPLARNYGTTGRSWGNGDFTYDAAGNVDFDDLLALARGYGRTVVGATAATATSPTRRRTFGESVITG